MDGETKEEHFISMLGEPGQADSFVCHLVFYLVAFIYNVDSSYVGRAVYCGQ